MRELFELVIMLVTGGCFASAISRAFQHRDQTPIAVRLEIYHQKRQERNAERLRQYVEQAHNASLRHW
jgi:hypothetical protein